MGTGIYGGFGKTKGFVSESRKKGELSYQKAFHSRDSIIEGIDKKTQTASQIAYAIRNGDIKINVLGDVLFNEYLGEKDSTLGVQVGKQLYVRASSLSILSDIIHEGVHVLDYIAGKKSSRWDAEMRAYKAEREFQIVTNTKVDFPDMNELEVHVWMNYERS